jgi:hypothetical protein
MKASLMEGLMFKSSNLLILSGGQRRDRTADAGLSGPRSATRDGEAAKEQECEAYQYFLWRSTPLPKRILGNAFLCGRKRVKNRKYWGIPAGFQIHSTKENRSQTKWRRERDSNPRSPFRLSGFQDRLFQPLTHPSGGDYLCTRLAGNRAPLRYLRESNR